jgi:hypothetical protein
VPFYGPPPPNEAAANVKAPLLVHLAANDSFVNPGWERYEPALKAAGVKYTAYVYPGTQHGFNNDTTPRYDAAAAKLAWDRTVAFFKTNLGTAAQRTARVRGTIESVAGDTIVVRTRSGEEVKLTLAPDLAVTEMYPVPLAEARTGTFVGVGGMPQPDGSQRAIAVVVFPEAMRGRGEGHYPFDYLPDSTMTNATVAEVAASPDGSRLRLRYKEGEKIIVVAPGTPIVSFRSADRSLMVPGASISLTAADANGVPTATRITAGRNGFAVPY